MVLVALLYLVNVYQDTRYQYISYNIVSISNVVLKTSYTFTHSIYSRGLQYIRASNVYSDNAQVDYTININTRYSFMCVKSVADCIDYYSIPGIPTAREVI